MLCFTVAYKFQPGQSEHLITHIPCRLVMGRGIFTKEDYRMTPEQWLAKHYPVPASALAEASDEE